MGFFTFKKETPQPPQTLAGFFTVDIIDVFPRDLKLVSTETTDTGTKLDTWMHNLAENFEFNIFNTMIVRQFNDSLTDYNLTFFALPSTEFPKELVRMAKYMTDKYGKDNSGLGYIAAEEIEKVLTGNMWLGRFWPDHMRIAYGIRSNEEWELDLYGNQKGK